ncbi:MAG: TerD family protein [Oscillospiraceae bacterium]|nr:TerD family protein [Oscillospiraceae bacterium]
MQENVLTDLEQKLDCFQGLAEVKSQIHVWISLLQSLHDNSIPLHLVFMGKPKTGKTETAKLIAQAYYALGLLSEGKLIQSNASDLTEISIFQLANQALGSVLMLTHVNAMPKQVFLKLFDILQWENLAVILSGTSFEIEKLLYQFPPLRLKFSNYLDFTDIQPENLEEMISNMHHDTFDISSLISRQEQISETEFSKIAKLMPNALAIDSKEGDFLESGARMDLTPYVRNEIKIRLAYQKFKLRMEIDAYVFLLSQDACLTSENMLFFGNASDKNHAVSIAEHAIYPECAFRLHKVDQTIQKIAVCFSIYGNHKNLNFSQIQNPVLQIFQGNTQLGYLHFSNLQKRSVIAVELYRYKNSWKLHAISDGYDNLEQLCSQFGMQI